MGFRRRFIVGLAWRLALVLVTGFGFVQSLLVEGLGAARLVAGLLVVGAAALLWRHVQRTNVELARFIDATSAEGSNNWTIAPGRTATGRPILANDLYSAVVPQVVNVDPPAPHRAAHPHARYIVRRGDTLVSIVRKLHCSSVQELAQMNGLHRHHLAVGQALRVPECR